MISLSVSDALHHFSDLLHRVRHQGEWALLTEGGHPVARMLPVNSAPKGAELLTMWADCPRLEEEAASFEADMAASREKLPAQTSRWD